MAVAHNTRWMDGMLQFHLRYFSPGSGIPPNTSEEIGSYYEPRRIIENLESFGAVCCSRRFLDESWDHTLLGCSYRRYFLTPDLSCSMYTIFIEVAMPTDPLFLYLVEEACCPQRTIHRTMHSFVGQRLSQQERWFSGSQDTRLSKLSHGLLEQEFLL